MLTRGKGEKFGILGLDHLELEDFLPGDGIEHVDEGERDKASFGDKAALLAVGDELFDG